MPNIENFNQNQLDLIIEGVDSYTFDETSGDYVRMSVFDENNTLIYQFYSYKDLNGNIVNHGENGIRQVIVYRNNQKIYVKPNEILEYNSVLSGRYRLQFDFMRDYFYSHNGGSTGEFATIASLNEEFYIHQISPSRKEVRLFGRTGENEPIVMDDNFQTQFQTIFGWIDERNKIDDEHEQYLFDYVFGLTRARNWSIVNYAFDTITYQDNPSLVIRFNEALPSGITQYDKVNIHQEIITTQTEEIIYQSEITSTIVETSLTPDVSVYDELENLNYDDTPQNYEDLIDSGSMPELSVESVLGNQADEHINLNIDFNYFKNHTFFGSAKEKLKNFKTKVGDIQNNLTEISSSLHLSGSTINSRRKTLFDNVTKITNNFTPYERWLYSDGQSQTTGSAPGLGYNLVSSKPTNSQRLVRTLVNYDGFNVVQHHSGSSGESVRLFTNKYNAQDSPFFNYSGSIYLSFLMKANEAITGSNTNVLQWKNSNAMSSTNLHIPSGALYQNRILEPQVSESIWRRYIYQASQSYWAPHGGGQTGGDINNITLNEAWNEPAFWNILHGDASSGSYAIQDTSGQYGELIQPTIYDDDGNLNTNIPRTGSVLPSGDYFDISFIGGNSQNTNVTSSYLTDIKVTKNNPLSALPFSMVYSTGSDDFTNWYNGLYSSASQFDDLNINSLENNLPVYIQESTEYNDAKQFIRMYGEHFDTIKSYIDNYVKFYKREYDKLSSVPQNLLPVLGDNLGWEFINPYTGSLAEYFELVSDGGDNLNNIKYETWRKVLNNLIYIYKTKGTHNSLNALLNSYGFPPGMFTFQEAGGTIKSSVDVTNLSNQVNTLLAGLENETGELAFTKKKSNFYSLNMKSPRDEVPLKKEGVTLNWHQDDANTNAIEFVFKANPSPNEQILLLAQNSGSTSHYWDLRLIPSSSNTTFAKAEFRLHKYQQPTGSIVSSSISMSTDYLPDLTNNKLWNVLLQRMTGSTNVADPLAQITQSYQLAFGLQDKDKIKNYTVVSMSNDVPFNTSHYHVSWSNINFVTSSISTKRLIRLAPTLSGSIGELRAWSVPLSGSRFKQHIFNKNSTVGNSINSQKDELIYHFKFNENYHSGSGYDGSSARKKFYDANPNNIKDYSFVITAGGPRDGAVTPSMYNVTYDVDRITSYIFSSNNGFNNQLNDNKITIKPQEYMTTELDPNQTSVNRVTGKKINSQFNSNKIIFSQNPIDKIDEFLINKISNHDVTQKFGKPGERYSGSYEDLESFKDTLYDGIKIDINKNIAAHSNKLPSGLKEGMRKIMPARTEFEDVGVVIRPSVVERQKIKYFKSKIYASGLDKTSNQFFDGFHEGDLDMSYFYSLASGSQVLNPKANQAFVNLEDYLLEQAATLFDVYTMELNYHSSSLKLNDSSIYKPYESNIIYASGSMFGWNMDKTSPHESNINYSGSFVNWNMDKISPYDSNIISASNIFNISNTDFSQPYKSNMVNYSGSVINWNMDKTSPHESNNIQVSGSVFNWLYEILTPYDSNAINISSGSHPYNLNKFTPEIYNPYESNINYSGSVINWNMDKISSYESNNLDISGSMFNWMYNLLTPYETNIIEIASGSNSLYNMTDEKLFTPYDSNKLDISGSILNWNFQYDTIYESNNLDISGSMFNWLYNLISPYESNVINLVTGSTATHKLDSNLFTTKDSNNLDISGSMLNWNMDKISSYESNNLDISGSMLNWAYDFVKPYLSNVINLVTGSTAVHKLDSNLFTTKDSNVDVSGSVYNWNMKKTEPYSTTLAYSGSVINWNFEYIPGTLYEGKNTQLRDEYGLYGTRLGGIYTPDEAIYYGQGHPGSSVNSGKLISHWLDAYGTGSGDLHFWNWLTGSDGSHNTGFYDRRIIYRPIGDMEHVSCSVFRDGLVNKQGVDTKIRSHGFSKEFLKLARKPNGQPAEIIRYDNTDYTNTKHYPFPPLMVDKGKGWTYKSYRKNEVNTTEGLMDGRPIGRTIYFSTGSLIGTGVKGQEELVYPVNHFVNYPTSKVGLRHLMYEGTQWVSGSFQAVDPRGPEYDPFPELPAYTIQVEGSAVHGSRILKAVRNKDNTKRK